MNIYVHRKALKDSYTIGDLYVDGVFFSNTLEDKDRGLSQKLSLSQNKRLKVYGQTAIPVGTYYIDMYYWAKYRKKYPHLKNVPAFEGILIHNGTNKDDTLGCVLVGKNNVVGRITNDGTCNKLISMIEAELNNGGSVSITIGYDKPLAKSVGNSVAKKTIGDTKLK